jgi:hypothetical protein
MTQHVRLRTKVGLAQGVNNAVCGKLSAWRSRWIVFPSRILQKAEGLMGKKYERRGRYRMGLRNGMGGEAGGWVEEVMGRVATKGAMRNRAVTRKSYEIREGDALRG